MRNTSLDITSYRETVWLIAPAVPFYYNPFRLERLHISIHLNDP